MVGRNVVSALLDDGYEMCQRLFVCAIANNCECVSGHGHSITLYIEGGLLSSHFPRVGAWIKPGTNVNGREAFDSGRCVCRRPRLLIEFQRSGPTCSLPLARYERDLRHRNSTSSLHSCLLRSPVDACKPPHDEGHCCCMWTLPTT